MALKAKAVKAIGQVDQINLNALRETIRDVRGPVLAAIAKETQSEVYTSESDRVLEQLMREYLWHTSNLRKLEALGEWLYRTNHNYRKIAG